MTEPRPDPPRRRYADPVEPASAPADGQDTTARFTSAALIGLIGGIWGFFLPFGILVGFAGGAAIGYGAARWMVPGLAAGFARFLLPSGKTTPAGPALSRGESLAMQGDYEGAVEFYEAVLDVRPGDAEPALRIARLCRDHLHRFDDAVSWFRRARTIGLPASQERLVTREIIEIFDRRLATPERSIPELARLVERFPDDPSAPQLRDEIRQRRELLSRRTEESEDS